MTSFNRFTDRNRDQQDGFERGVWGSQEYVDGAGSVMRIRGTGTEDDEAPVLNTGFGFNLPDDSNAEVFMVSLGSDTNQKYAVASLPRDKQRQWAAGTGGVQHPTDPERALEFNADATWLKDGTFDIGNNKELRITVSGGNISIKTSGEINLESSKLTHNGLDIGSTHTHGGIQPGGSNTDVPNA